MSLLGASLVAQGRLAEAEPLLNDAVEHLTTLARAASAQTALRKAREHMARLCEARGDPAAAAAWRTPGGG